METKEKKSDLIHGEMPTFLPTMQKQKKGKERKERRKEKRKKEKGKKKKEKEKRIESLEDVQFGPTSVKSDMLYFILLYFILFYFILFHLIPFHFHFHFVSFHLHLFVCLFVCSFVRSFIHLFIYSFIHLFIYSFINWLIYSFIHLLIQKGRNRSKLLGRNGGRNSLIWLAGFGKAKLKGHGNTAGGWINTSSIINSKLKGISIFQLKRLAFFTRKTQAHCVQECSALTLSVTDIKLIIIGERETRQLYSQFHPKKKKEKRNEYVAVNTPNFSVSPWDNFTVKANKVWISVIVSPPSQLQRSGYFLVNDWEEIVEGD